jgi:predicted transcriptional regulator
MPEELPLASGNKDNLIVLLPCYIKMAHKFVYSNMCVVFDGDNKIYGLWHRLAA